MPGEVGALRAAVEGVQAELLRSSEDRQAVASLLEELQVRVGGRRGLCEAGVRSGQDQRSATQRWWGHVAEVCMFRACTRLKDKAEDRLHSIVTR